MTAKECIKGRRSVRKYADKPVSHEIISDLVETASYAPSWKHTQITRYIAVEGDLKARIANECTDIWPNNGTIINNAPVLMVITAIKNRSGFERDGSFSTPKGTGWENFDAGLSCENFCLAAHEAGLATVILGLFDETKVASILEIPEDRQVMALVPLGYADEAPVAPKRKEVSELLNFKS